LGKNKKDYPKKYRKNRKNVSANLKKADTFFVFTERNVEKAKTVR